MPAIDRCEPAIIRALQKDGWRIVQKPLAVNLLDGRNLYVDFMAARVGTEEEIIIVEVKCFPEAPLQLAEVYRALGQYLIYFEALNVERASDLLHMAIPESAYAMIVELDEVRMAMKRNHVKLIVCNIDKEEVVEWVT